MAKIPSALTCIGAGNADVPFFPSSHHLVVTTQKHVYSWNSHGLTELFCSGSEGIVAAKKAKDGSELLAIADSQVVVLHDAKKGMEKSYRLKGAEGQLRLLKYTSDSKNLFFTTSLQNSVQSYSLKQSRLLDPFHDHPSPPTCLALSPTSHLLLSCSTSPPTIFLQNLTLRTPPLNIRPSVSAAAVTVASFHPDRPNVFLLAFLDGALASYDANKLLRGGNDDRRVEITGNATAGEIAHFASLNGPNTATTMACPDDAALGKTGEHLPVEVMGSRAAVITAAEFLPGFRARVITVGADGRCNLVSFEGDGPKKAVILKSWHVRAPATSLSILKEGPLPDRTSGTIEGAAAKRRDRSTKCDNSQVDRPWIAAIGRVDGKVLIFNSNGELMRENTVDPNGRRVIDVEWAAGTVDAGSKPRPMKTTGSAKLLNKKLSVKIISKRPEPRALPLRKKRKSMSEILAAGREVEEEILPDVKCAERSGMSPQKVGQCTTVPISEPPLLEQESSKHALWQDVIEPPTTNYMSLFSPVKQKARRSSSKAATFPISKRRSSRINREEELQGADISSVVSAPLLDNDETPDQPLDPSEWRQSTPLKARRNPPRRNSSKGKEQNNSSQNGLVETEDGKLLAEIRGMSGKGVNVPGKGLALFAPYMQKGVIKDVPKRDNLHDDIWLPESSGNEASALKGPKNGRKPARKLPKPASNPDRKGPKSVSFRPSIDSDHDKSGTNSKGSPQRDPFIHGDSLELTKRLLVHTPQPSEYRSTPAYESSENHTSQPGPLIETTNNRWSPCRPPRKNGISKSPRCIAPPSLDALSKTSSCCPSHSHLHEDVVRLQEEVRSFQAEITRQFQAQRRWFEGVIVEERKANDAVRHENERLRRELFEVVKGMDRVAERES